MGKRWGYFCFIPLLTRCKKVRLVMKGLRRRELG